MPEKMKLEERNGEVIFFEPPYGYFGMLTYTVDSYDFHRRMHLVNIERVDGIRNFDINILVPYFKNGIQINIENFMRDLEDPEKVKKALENRKLKTDPREELQKLWKEKLHGVRYRNTSGN